MTGESSLVDTNVLIRWVQHDAPDYGLVKSAMQRLLDAGHVLCFTPQILGESWNVLTRPIQNNGYGFSPDQANARAQYIETSLKLLYDTPDVYKQWRHLLVTHSVRGVQIHDARLVASMQTHGVTKILTFNTKDFARYPGIQAIHPAQVPAA